MAVSSRCCGVVFTSLWRTIQAIHSFFHFFPSPSPPSSPHDEVAEKSRLLSHLTAEERAGCVSKDRENLVRRRGRADSEEDLQEEEKRLQACGNLPDSLAEMRKTVTFSDEVERSEIKIVQSALNASPHTNAEIQQSEAYSQSGISSVLESSPETPEEIRNSKTFAEILVHREVQEPRTQMKASPYPTPRKITDDMQTPGTVFATSIKGLRKGNARIRSQYVRGVLNPVENFQLDDLKESNSFVPSMLDGEDENLLQPEDSASSSAQQSCGNAATEEIKGKTEVLASLHG